MAKINLPQDVMNYQQCTVCGSLLSVGPVKVSSIGEIICGRYNCRHSIQGETQNSMYNILAAACLFKCVYGCEKMLAFNEAEEHEKTCNKRMSYSCRFCFYNGNRYAMVCHFQKMHPTYKINKVPSNKVCYTGINKHIDAILKMSALEVRQFIGNMPKVLLTKCQNCNCQIRKRKNVYFCPQLHMACQKCAKTKCTQCAGIFPWNRNMVLDDKILLECEWDGCSKKFNVFEYIWHKQTCTSRPYECPSPGCGYVSCLKDLKKHWHIFPPIKEKTRIIMCPRRVRHWLPPCKEMIEVTYEVAPDKTATVTINQKNAIVPVGYSLTLISGFESPRKICVKKNPNQFERNVFDVSQVEGINYIVCQVYS